MVTTLPAVTEYEDGVCSSDHHDLIIEGSAIDQFV